MLTGIFVSVRINLYNFVRTLKAEDYGTHRAY